MSTPGMGKVPVWIDTLMNVHEKLHTTGPTMVLIRPDGYISYRWQPADGDALMEYLSGYLVRKEV